MSVIPKGVVVVPAATGSAPGHDGCSTQLIANRPIVCHALENLLRAGIEAVAVVASPSAIGQVRRCMEQDGVDADVTFLSQDGPGDVRGALSAAAGFVGDDAAIVHFADGLLGQELRDFGRVLNGNAADLLLLLHHGGDERERLGPAALRMLGVAELSEARSRLALTGVCVFGTGTLRRVVECAHARNGHEADLIAVAQCVAEQDLVLEAAFVHGWRRYTGNPADLLELNRIVLDRQAPDGKLFDTGDNRIEGRVIIHPTADVSSSIILGPSIIGPRAQISNSYIGPYTSVGAGAQIENAEVVRSIIAEEARIMHIAGRIEGSTIGRGASIFRDFSLPRAMRLHVGEGVEVALD